MKKVFINLKFRFGLFKKGEKNLKHKKRSGVLNTATTDDGISKIQAFINSNQYCTYDEIKAEFQISRETIHNVINNCFKLKKKFHQDGYLIN